MNLSDHVIIIKNKKNFFLALIELFLKKACSEEVKFLKKYSF